MFLLSRCCLFHLRCHPSHSRHASYSALFFQQGSKRNTYLTPHLFSFFLTLSTSKGHTWAPHLTKRITVDKKGECGKESTSGREGET